MVLIAILLANLLAFAWCFSGSPEHDCKDVDAVLLVPGDSSSQEFRCTGSGLCIDISRWCDGQKDCRDHSDEVNCAESGSENDAAKDSSIEKLEQAALQQEIFERRKEAEEKADRKRRKEQDFNEARLKVLAEAKELLEEEKHNHSTCQNARQGSDCFNHILFAMNHGIFENPNWYPSLSEKSSFRDFQGLLHGVSRNECPRPCFDKESGCLDLSKQNTCVLRIQWVRQVELIQHRDWYPELSPDSSDWDIAESLWQRGEQVCHRPCRFGEVEDPNVRPAYPTLPVTLVPETTTTTPMTSMPRLRTEESSTTRKIQTTARIETTIAPTLTTSSKLKIQAATVTTSSIPTSTATTTRSAASVDVSSSQTTTEKVSSTPETPTTAAEFVFMASTTSSMTSSTTFAPPKEPVHCREEGVSYLPIDIAGLPPTHEASASDCQDRCAKTAGAAYYSFYTPSRTCHCESAEVATRQEGSYGYIAGETRCAEVPQNPETVHILQNMQGGCYDAGAYYFPVIMELSSYQQDVLQCQEQCRSSNRCAYFSFFSLDKSCQLADSQATRQEMLGAISGPPACQDTLKLFLARPILSEPVRSNVAAAGILLLFATMAAFLLMRIGRTRASFSGQPQE